MGEYVQSKMWVSESEYNRNIAVAKWAEVFSVLGIRCSYSRSIELRSDLYLPDQKIFFGVTNRELCKDCGPVSVIGTRDGRFKMAGDCSYSETWLTFCQCCGKRFFLDSTGSFECPICGAYDGDHHLGETFYGEDSMFKKIFGKFC